MQTNVRYLRDRDNGILEIKTVNIYSHCTALVRQQAFLLVGKKAIRQRITVRLLKAENNSENNVGDHLHLRVLSKPLLSEYDLQK